MKLSLTTFTEEIPNIWSEIETIRAKVIEFHQRKRAKAVILNRFTHSNERIKIYQTRFTKQDLHVERSNERTKCPTKKCVGRTGLLQNHSLDLKKVKPLKRKILLEKITKITPRKIKKRKITPSAVHQTHIIVVHHLNGILITIKEIP